MLPKQPYRLPTLLKEPFNTIQLSLYCYRNSTVIPSKEPYAATNRAPECHQKSPTLQKSPVTPWTELKEPCAATKRALYCYQKSPVVYVLSQESYTATQRALYQHQKSPILPSKEPCTAVKKALSSTEQKSSVLPSKTPLLLPNGTSFLLTFHDL